MITCPPSIKIEKKNNTRALHATAVVCTHKYIYASLFPTNPGEKKNKLSSDKAAEFVCPSDSPSNLPSAASFEFLFCHHLT